MNVQKYSFNIYFSRKGGKKGRLFGGKLAVGIHRCHRLERGIFTKTTVGGWLLAVDIHRWAQIIRDFHKMERCDECIPFPVGTGYALSSPCPTIRMLVRCIDRLNTTDSHRWAQIKGGFAQK
jgi:hypothetical protein